MTAPGTAASQAARAPSSCQNPCLWLRRATVLAESSGASARGDSGRAASAAFRHDGSAATNQQTPGGDCRCVPKGRIFVNEVTIQTRQGADRQPDLAAGPGCRHALSQRQARPRRPAREERTGMRGRTGRAVAALQGLRNAREPGAGRGRISAAVWPVLEVRGGWRRARQHLRPHAMQLDAPGRPDYRFSGRAPLEWMSCSGSWRNAREYQYHPSGYRPAGHGRPYFSRSNRAAGYCHASVSARSGRRSRRS